MTNYASLMGVTVLEAQKDNIAFELANMQGLGNSNAMFSFTLRLTE